MFPNTVTPKEEEKGFRVVDAKTGYGTILGTEETTQIVLLPKGDQDRILKVGEDKYQFQHLIHGKDSEHLDSWNPTEDRTYTLEELSLA